MSKFRIIVILLPLLIVSCTTTGTFPARLYNLSDAGIIQAQFQFSGTTYGSISFILPSGEQFTGEYQTITGGSAQWGSIYGTAWDSFGVSMVSGESGEITLPYKGTAVMTSDKGTVMTCEYISNRSRWTQHGYGVCKDNRGQTYQLMY